MNTAERANLATARIKAGEDEATVLAELGFDALTEASHGSPWSKDTARDSRNTLEQAAGYLVRTEGLSDLDAIARAIRMPTDEAIKLAANEASHFEAQAKARAEKNWANSPDGIAEAGRKRLAEQAAIAEKAKYLRPELEARGVPLDGMTDAEVVAFVTESAEQQAEANDNNSLAANVAAATAGGESA
jgi:hypothetical protein